MFKSKSHYILILLVLALLISTVNAQDGEVTVQFNWVHDSAFVGFYIAEDEGYYADQGLDVEVKLVFDDEGNFIDSVEEVAAGRAQFGIADAGTLMQARASGVPIIGIAANFQRNPLAFISLAENDILTPDDLIGKTVEISEYNLYMFEALLSIYDIDPSEVNIVERTDYSTDPLTSGASDVQDAWVTNEIAVLSVQGVDINAIYPFEYGIDMYPDVIFTSEDMIANSPEIVAGFLEATLAGIQSAVDDVDSSVAYVLERDDTLLAEAVSESLVRAVPLFAPSGSQPGMMLPEVWEIGHEILLDAGILEGAIDISDAYTLEFLNAIYE